VSRVKTGKLRGFSEQAWVNAGWRNLDFALDWYNAGWRRPEMALIWYRAGWTDPRHALVWYRAGYWHNPTAALAWKR